MPERRRQIENNIKAFRHSIEKGKEEIAANIARCVHVPRIHSQRRRLNGGWWIHTDCTLCGGQFSREAEGPECPACHVPLQRTEIPAETLSIGNAARVEDPYATAIYVFRCCTCKELFAFPIREDTKK